MLKNIDSQTIVGSVVEYRDGIGELVIGTVVEKGSYVGETYVVVETSDGNVVEICESDAVPVWLVA